MKLRFPESDTHFKPEDWNTYQLPQYQALVKVAPHRGLALDCGGHAGIMTRRMARDFAQVIAFEPVHTDLIRENTQDLTNVQIFSLALSDRSGTAQMSTNTENTGDNRIDPTGELSVNTVTIDDLKLSRVAVIKMDIQGGEYPALIGAAATITRDHPALLIETERWDTNGSRIQTLLRSWGYIPVFRKSADTVYAWRS